MHSHYFNIAVEPNNTIFADTPEPDDHPEYFNYECESIPNDPSTVELVKNNKELNGF